MNTEKITSWHKERLAIVYVRQSTLTQVLNNHEGKERQYGLKDYAASLGFRNADVIDADLGKTGSGLVERPGFAKLLEQICTGEVGAVLALEASRLARNNRDWHHLVDLCAMTNTLVIDYDGVYDARLLNDRLLLGLKGTMSEFELGLLRQRAQQALRQKIARGEVLHVAPIGYDRTEDNRLEMTPDLQIQQAIREVFARFRECGSARQVLLICRQEGVLLPSRDLRGRVVWQPAIWGRIIKFLKNPAYAGAYAYGRTKTRIAIEDGRQRRTSGHSRDRDEWIVLIKDNHAGYITWPEYESNQTILLENAAMKGKMRTAAKGGSALLAGLLRCGHCGRPLHVHYGKRDHHRYSCRGANLSHGGTPCISIGWQRMEQRVGDAVVDAVQPHGIAASLEAERLAVDQRRRQRDAIALALEKARYEGDRARRQFAAVEPENRLVASELERRWNAALGEINRLEKSLDEHDQHQTSVAAAEAEQLRALGADLQKAWEHPDAPRELKKRILRTVIKEIVVKIDPDPNLKALPAPQEALQNPKRADTDDKTVTLTLHWTGGAHSELRFAKWSRGHHHFGTPRDAVELIRALIVACSDEQIASILNRGGHRTGKGLSWKTHHVEYVRRTNDIAEHNPNSPRSWVTMEEAADILGVAAATVRRLIEHAILPASQITPHAPWFIERGNLRLPVIVRSVEHLKRTGRLLIPKKSANNLELAFNADQK